MNRRVRFGVSVYLSSFEQQKRFLEQLRGEDVYIFTSFHITEEIDKYGGYEIYKNEILKMIAYLKDRKFIVVADISRKTLRIFQCATIEELSKSLKIDILRIDYGFTKDEIRKASENVRLAINASTVTEFEAERIVEVMPKPLALHNYYPRPETGLSEEVYMRKSQKLEKIGFEIGAFIAGDTDKRGPIGEGLPTLEHQRYLNPYISALEMFIKFETFFVFLSDLDMQIYDYNLIFEYQKDNILRIPIVLDEKYSYLYDQIFTIREDSGAYAYRFKESREYSMANSKGVERGNCVIREVGMLTMDNDAYARYAGEIQLIYKELPSDEKVNVIGKVAKEYLGLMPLIRRGDRVKLIPSY